MPELTLDQRLRALAAQGRASSTHEGAGDTHEREAVDGGDSDSSDDAAPTTGTSSVADVQADDETTAAFL